MTHSFDIYCGKRGINHGHPCGVVWDYLGHWICETKGIDKDGRMKITFVFFLERKPWGKEWREGTIIILLVISLFCVEFPI